MAPAWRVELTHGFVAALRGLPHADRAAIAARIDHLADAGVPPSLRDERDERGAVALPVGEHVLVCLQIPEEHRIVLVTLGSARASAGAAIASLLGRATRRWIDHGEGGGMMGTTFQDLRFALRSLRRSPGFGLAATLTLALGIGSMAAIFSVAKGVLFEPLPYADPDEVVTLWTSWDYYPDKTWVSIPEYQLFHQESRTLDDLALYGTGRTNFTSVESPEQVGAAFLTPNTFEVLGVQPVIGRTFTWEEARAEVSGVLLSYDTWQRRFGLDPSIVGRSVELNGESTPVIGVMPEGFVLPVDYASAHPTQVFFPFYVDLEAPAPDLGSGGSHGWYGVGRLADGVTLEEARADLQRIMAQVEPLGLYSPERRFQPRLFEAKADIVGTADGTIKVLLGAVLFLLLIACGNVANLLLSRSEARLREVAVRTALGAGRRRILRQLLTESVVLALIAGVVGCGLAVLGVRTLLSIDPDAVPRAGTIALDAPVFLFTLAVALLTAVVFGAVPAVRVTRAGLGGTLGERGRGGQSGAGSNRMRGMLVAAQMAMAVILLTGAGLMVRTFVGLLRVDPGFHGENVLTVRISASSGRYPGAAEVDRFYQEVLRRVREIPGVESAGAVRLLPLVSTIGNSYFRPVGYEPEENEGTQGDWQWATPGYIETMGIPLVEGRTFDESDRRGSRPVVMINEVLARRYWPGGSALGREVEAGGGEGPAVVIGVVGNVSHNGLTAERMERYYRVHGQIVDDRVGSMRSMTLTIATRGEPGRYLDAVRTAIRAVDPSVPLSEVRTLDDVLASSVAQPRFAMVLLVAFAVLALTLAIVGIYGVLAYAVSQRTREIGIRMALGAERGRVTGMVVREGMRMALGGVALGMVVAWFVTGLMEGLLYGVGARDPATFLAVPALFAGVALLACWLPAARAARVQPASALRYE